LVATIEGGEGGFSRIKKSAGIAIPIVMREWIVMYKSNLPFVSSLEGPPSSASTRSSVRNIIKISI